MTPGALGVNTLIGSLPRHLYVWVDSRFTHKRDRGFVRAVWFGLVSYPGRVWGCNVMFESGAVYRSVPPHAIGFRLDASEWAVSQAQMWDCYSYQWTAHEYEYLKGLRCAALIGGERAGGEYLFTAAPLGDGFSAAPEQAKEFMFIKLDNGRLTIQPTNRVLFEDRSFTEVVTDPPKLKLQEEVWSCEL